MRVTDLVTGVLGLSRVLVSLWWNVSVFVCLWSQHLNLCLRCTETHKVCTPHLGRSCSAVLSELCLCYVYHSLLHIHVHYVVSPRSSSLLSIVQCVHVRWKHNGISVPNPSITISPITTPTQHYDKLTLHKN